MEAAAGAPIPRLSPIHSTAFGAKGCIPCPSRMRLWLYERNSKGLVARCCCRSARVHRIAANEGRVVNPAGTV